MCPMCLNQLFYYPCRLSYHALLPKRHTRNFVLGAFLIVVDTTYCYNSFYVFVLLVRIMPLVQIPSFVVFDFEMRHVLLLWLLLCCYCVVIVLLLCCYCVVTPLNIDKKSPNFGQTLDFFKKPSLIQTLARISYSWQPSAKVLLGLPRVSFLMDKKLAPRV